MENTLQSFPHDACQAIAMLYLERQDLTGLTPEEIFEKYIDAYNRICERDMAIPYEKKPHARNFV